MLQYDGPYRTLSKFETSQSPELEVVHPIYLIIPDLRSLKLLHHYDHGDCDSTKHVCSAATFTYPMSR